MSFRVRGTLDGAAYEVEVGGAGDQPVVGSRLVARLVQQYEGRKVLAGPTGPMVKVTAASPATLLALLSAKTKIASLDGDVPAPLGGPRVADAVE